MTTSGNWKPNWIRGGKVTNVAWIGKDVMAWCSGMYIIFYNVQNKQQFIRWCSKSSTGEGACCISSHPTLNIFAYAEKVTNPRIFVYSYPSMTKLSECSRGSGVGYLATTFAYGDFLVSSGTFPSFTLIVWSWRTGEKLKSIATCIHDADSQILRASYKKPVLVAQMGQASGKLCIWDITVAGKIVILKDFPVILPNKALVNDMSWCPEAEETVLAIVDKEGHIYLSNRDGSIVKRIVVSQRCAVCLDIESAAICWFGGGIVLRTTFCQIRFYKKDQSDIWHKQWYVKTEMKPCVLTSHPFKNDRLFFHTLQGHVMQLTFNESQQTPVIETRLYYGAIVQHVEFIYPWGHHLVLVDDSMFLAVLESQSGNEINRFDLDMHGDITCLASHLDYPMIAVTSAQGEVVLVSLLEPIKPRIFGRYHLQKEMLNFLKFSQSGRFLIVGEKNTGVIYCVDLSLKKHFSIIGQLLVKRQILNLFAFETKDSLKVFILHRTTEQVHASHQILVYEISKGKTEFSEIISAVEFPYGYRNFEYVPGNPFLLIGMPCQSRQLHVIRLKDWKEISIVDAFVSGHQLKRAFVFTDRQWITSSGVDGVVIVRDNTIRTSKIVLMTHHRKDFGVVKAIVKASGDLIIALGKDGSLVSMIYFETDTTGNEEKKENINSSLDQIILDMLSRPLQEFAPPEEREDMTWTEWMMKKKILEEEMQYAEKKASILHRFGILKAKIVKMIDENETCPEIEKLPLAAFDLDKVSREHKIKAARDEREDTRLELEHNCAQMERLSDFIKTKFWDTQVNLATSIFSIFGSTEIQNYAYDSCRPHLEEHQRWAVFTTDIINQLMEQNSFAPWRLYTASELDVELKKEGRIQKIDEKGRMDALLGTQEEEVQGAVDDLQNRLDSEGKTTHYFVEPCQQIFSQFACYSYSQFKLQNTFHEMDAKKLREYWNKKFEEMFGVKEREMALIRERIEKIEHIDSELKLMFNQNVPKMPPYPEWQLKEMPEKIIVVHDHEVKAKPYISPSEQEVLDQKAAEAERMRLLLLADDFRERALMSMMDGVLEIRWEDTIKKDIPKPKCMLKPADQHTAEDVLAIMQYEKDVENLAQERERYKRMLEADFIKVNGILKEGIEKFNSRLLDSFQLRMKVEAAIKQQNFKFVRFCMRNRYRVESIKKDEEMKEQIEENRNLMNEMSEQVRIVQGVIQDLQTYYDNLCTREKVVEKKFKSEFPGLGKGASEILQNQYKRRPRTILKNIVANDLLDLGNAAVALTKPVHLPVECLDYLKSLDLLDVRPASIPPSVTSNHWDTFVRLRRNKIDIEMKIRAQELEIKEANYSIQDYNGKISIYKSNINQLKIDMNYLRQETVEYDRNIEIQLVLKMGQVEIESQLTRHDTKNSLLIPRSEIVTVNQKILEVGGQKINVMKRALNFRKGIALKEWEHKCLKMKIEDLKDELHYIENIQVTKQIQYYLKRKAKGFKDDKTPQHLERQLEAMRKSFEKIFREYVLKLEDVEKKTKIIKKKNELLDSKIINMNVVRCEMELKRDLVGEAKQREFQEKKMAMIIKRSSLIRKLQENYVELLALQTEHELLRMKKFPILPIFKILDDNDDPDKEAC